MINQRLQLGLAVINLLLVVLLCFYLETPTRIVKRFTIDYRRREATIYGFTTTGDDNLPEISQGQSPKNLSQSVIDNVKTFVFFLGHARSGHSIVGSLMDSHPHMVIANELDLFAQLSGGSLAPTKSEIFNALWKNTKSTLVNGLRAKSAKGYTLTVDGLYQGKYVDHIDVIGDKKAGTTTTMLVQQPDKWLNVFNTLNSLINALSLKVIYVIRNPYDNIATSILYLFDSAKEVGDAKQSNKTFEIDSDTIEKMIKTYFSCYQGIVDATKRYNLDIIEIHGKDLISDPRSTLLKMCNDLGVTCSNNYLEICSNKIFKTESRTRHMIKWTDKQLQMIQQNIEKFSSLNGYNFDSM